MWLKVKVWRKQRHFYRTPKIMVKSQKQQLRKQQKLIVFLTNTLICKKVSNWASVWMSIAVVKAIGLVSLQNYN